MEQALRKIYPSTKNEKIIGVSIPKKTKEEATIVVNLGPLYIEGSVDDLIDRIKELQKKYYDLYINKEEDSDYYGTYVSYEVIGRRQETTVEYEQRQEYHKIKRAEKKQELALKKSKREAAEKKREEEDRKLYEELHKRFGKK